MVSVLLYANEMVGGWFLEGFRVGSGGRKGQGRFRGLGLSAPLPDLWGGDRGWVGTESVPNDQ